MRAGRGPRSGPGRAGRATPARFTPARFAAPGFAAAGAAASRRSASSLTCRACRSDRGEIVLDLGEQPAADHFPAADDAGADPRYPLQMWLCRLCGLAQLGHDPTTPEEPRGTEPAALVEQAAEAVRRVAAAGLLSSGSTVVEFGSPHGGSWLGHLAGHGMTQVPAPHDARADVVLDCFGLMHAPDQAAALETRVRRMAPGATLLLQYHSLETIVRLGQWSALRHGHFAYYSTTALVGMLARAGCVARTAWQFDLYGGTVLLAARRATEIERPPDDTVRALLASEAAVGVTEPGTLAGLERTAEAAARSLRGWLAAQRADGHTIVGYGAASRAVATLVRAGADRALLPAVVDTSPAKHGRRMPGTDIPIVPPSMLAERRPDAVLLFVPDLLGEVRRTYPGVEEAGGRWVDAQALVS